MSDVNLKDKSVTELKAMAYDQVALVEQCQKNLSFLNAAIAEKLGKTSTINNEVSRAVKGKEVPSGKHSKPK